LRLKRDFPPFLFLPLFSITPSSLENLQQWAVGYTLNGYCLQIKYIMHYFRMLINPGINYHLLVLQTKRGRWNGKCRNYNAWKAVGTENCKKFRVSSKMKAVSDGL